MILAFVPAPFLVMVANDDRSLLGVIPVGIACVVAASYSWTKWQRRPEDSQFVAFVGLDRSRQWATYRSMRYGNEIDDPVVLTITETEPGVKGDTVSNVTKPATLETGAVIQVPLFDMLRYHLIGAGASWIGEYGDPRIPEEAAYIAQYSAYQQLRPETEYPRVYITTNTRDDRVHPGHARKMMARMKEQGHDVLYYENIEGGHGGAADNRQLTARPIGRGGCLRAGSRGAEEGGRKWRDARSMRRPGLGPSTPTHAWSPSATSSWRRRTEESSGSRTRRARGLASASL